MKLLLITQKVACEKRACGLKAPVPKLSASLIGEQLQFRDPVIFAEESALAW